MPATTKKKKLYIRQAQSELQAMADYYGQEYQEVYFVRCLKSNHVIAVECAPAITNRPTVERTLGRRNIFGYQEQFLTTRYRLDKNENGQRMVGYECACGNDTRMSDTEKGIVPESKVTRSQVAEGKQPRQISLSPFERAQLQTAVTLNQAASKKKADYEVGATKGGHHFERFETFQLERMK